MAVVGASADTSKWGGDVAARLVRDERRAVYLVNRRGGKMHGREAYPSLRSLPETPELVVLAMPAAAFEEVLDDALGMGVRALVGIFAGLGETGPEGKERERIAVERLRAAGAVLLGPNCMGLADHTTGFEAVAYLDIPRGAIGFVSQSGAMGEEFVMRAREWGCGFSRYVTLGNQADVSAAEVLAGFSAHADTRVVALYAEDFSDGLGLVSAAASVVAAGKPVVMLAPGRSAASVRAARSHTGSLASDAAGVDAACRAGGIMRVDTPRELFEITVALQDHLRLRGRRVAVASDGGGPGGIAADALVAAGFSVSEFDPLLTARLREALPGSAGSNPLDFALGTIEPDAFARALPPLVGSHEVDAVFAVGQLGYWSARFPEFGELAEAEVRSARDMAAAAARSGTPLVVSTVYPHSLPAAELRARGVPVYREIASGVAALRALGAVTPHAEGVPEAPGPAEPCPPSPDYESSRRLLEAAGVPFVAGRRVADAAEAVAAADELGYPVVLKALGVLHKSDVGGVVLGLGDEDELRAALVGLQERLRPPGFVVERLAPRADGLELIVGCRRDARFGPILLVGLGGVYAELFADWRTALAPARPETITTMLAEIRGAQLLHGARGRPPLDVAAAAAAAAALSRFAAAHPEVSEVETNPLLVLQRGVVALDARILTEPVAGGS